jgi:enoyl-CoA hydratase / long-chain 3-hydroxyacyl-CoA dehydrogenase
MSASSIFLSSCRVSTKAIANVAFRPRTTSSAVTTDILRSYPIASSLPNVTRLLRYQSNAAVATESVSSPSSSTGIKDNKVETTAPFVPTDSRKYEYFTNVEITPFGIAMIQFDGPKKAVNTISFAMAEEAKKLWKNEIETNTSVKAVVFISAKPGMFIAGADIFDIQRITNKQELLPLIEDGVSFFQHMRSKKIPLIAAIDGPALGGGLEWALWCDYRICTDNNKTKLGLPEVKLGLLPGFGGTQNLHPLVGLQNAMDMMLTGKEIRPDKAKKMGLVDLVVAPQSLKSVAVQQAEQLASGALKISRKKKSLFNRLLEDNSIGQNIIWGQINKMVQKNTNGKYPAPFAIIDCVKNGLANASGNGKYKFEREQFVKLASTSESEALIGIFDGMTSMKKHSYGDNAAIPVKTVTVLGAGLMGAGIAQVSAEKGYNVLLKDRNDEAIGRGVSYMQDNWNKKVQRKSMTKYDSNLNSSRVIGLTDENPMINQHLGKTDLIIEAVFENLDLKRQIVANMEAVCSEKTIFATNTSAIPIREIAAQAKRPENIIGMHYFSPVPSMPLLEIIPHSGTSDTTIATAFEVGAKQGKTCIVVKDVPGFYVNRCLGPYLVEVSALVKDGVPLEKLDKAITDFGMPVGPITLADEVGIDVSSHVASFLSEADLGVRMEGGDVSLMKNMVEKGWLGKKSGQGFYTYGKKKGSKKEINSEVQAYVKIFVTRDLGLKEKEIQDRIVSRYV